MAEKKKRTAEQAKSYISERAKKARLSSERTMITGPDLQRAAAKIELIPDAQLRKEVHNLLVGMPKYQALDMLVHPAGKYFKAFPEVMDQIALEATETDAAVVRVIGTIGPAV